MKIDRTRRSFTLLGGLAAVSPWIDACSPKTAPRLGTAHDAPDPFAAIEASVGGRVGVFALDAATGKELAHRADERFAMCSTFKWTLAAALLARVDRGELHLEESVSYDASDLLDHAPTTRANIGSGQMTLGSLAEAAVTVSDNTAANLVLARIGGPAALTSFLRSIGDTVTRLDRNEPALNTNEPGDPRDTTSPRAMAHTLMVLSSDKTLSEASRAQLLDWMKHCKTGLERLRAGLPNDWPCGDKTGTGERGASNDVAIAWPPLRAPIVIASYLSGGLAEAPALNRAHAEIARVIARSFG